MFHIVSYGYIYQFNHYGLDFITRTIIHPVQWTTWRGPQWKYLKEETDPQLSLYFFLELQEGVKNFQGNQHLFFFLFQKRQ